MTNDTTAPDLIERLRESQRLYEEAGVDGSEGAIQAKEAADALEAAQARIAELEGALEEIYKYPSGQPIALGLSEEDWQHRRAEQMRFIARAALEGKG